MNPADTPRPFVKISALARLSGVPAATIKHYLREGLFPAPMIRTSRNMAFYDPALVDRIRQIKELQRTHFLPLRVIRGVLEGRAGDDDDAETAAAIGRALESMAQKDVRTEAQLVAAGLPAKDLALFESLGLVSSTERDGRRVFAGDDLALLRVLGASRRAGLTPDMLPPDILGAYAQALGLLVEVELRMFREGVVPRGGDDLPRLADAATRLSEQLVVLIRRKLLLPTLRSLVEAQAAAQAAEKIGAKLPPEKKSPRARKVAPSRSKPRNSR